MFRINYKKWLPWARRNSAWLILSGTFLALLIVAAAFYFNFFLYRDTLVKQAPADSLVYWRFNLVSALDDYHRLDTNVAYQQIDRLLAWPVGQFAREIQLLVGREAALVIVPWQEEKSEENNRQLETVLGKAILIRLSRSAKVDNDKLNGLGIHQARLSRRLLVLADSEETLKKITEASSENNLRQITSIKKGLGKIDNRYLSKGYIDVRGLDKYFQEKNGSLPADFNALLVRLSTDFLLSQDQLQLFFWSQKAGAGFACQVVGSKKDSWPEQAKSFPRLIKYLPPDTLMAWSGFNWQTILDSLDKTFTQTNSGLEKHLANYEKLYRFDWQTDLAPLLAGRGDLIVLPESDPKTRKQKDFIINVNSPAADSAAVVRLEEIVKEYLAYHLPMEKIRTLPDNSRVTELITSPGQFAWQATSENNLSFSYINTPDLEFEFVHALLPGNSLVFGNSLEKLKTFERNQLEPAADWLNFQKAVKGSFWPRNQQAIFINLKELGAITDWQKLFPGFNYLGIVSNQQGFKASIY
ncbi:MAG: DUF3352 domain-containing protein [bacterium]